MVQSESDLTETVTGRACTSVGRDSLDRSYTYYTLHTCMCALIKSRGTGHVLSFRQVKPLLYCIDYENIHSRAIVT